MRARIIAYAPSHHLLLHGTEGSFVKYGMDPQEEILRGPNYPDGLDWGKDWGRETEKQWGTLTRVGENPRKIETEPGDYRGFYANMRDAIEEEGPAGCPAQNNSSAPSGPLALAHKSSREKRVVGGTNRGVAPAGDQK